jgi:thiosulfate reductase cytochrome b subunit
MSTHRVKIYAGFERLWHWLQALFIILLMVTGFEIHGTYVLFGFERAVWIHTNVAWAFIGLIVLAIFWHITTGEWRQYRPSGPRSIVTQGQYYAVGIFKDEPHPYRKSELTKLNPLQKVTYLGFKLLIVPVMVTTGLLYMYYNSWSASWVGGLAVVAIIHTLGAFALVMFLVVHVYMTTTGETPLSNVEAMITGYEDVEDEPEHPAGPVAGDRSVSV